MKHNQVRVVNKVGLTLVNERYIQLDPVQLNRHDELKQRSLKKRLLKRNNPGSESKVIVNKIAEDEVK
jgi:hypothetical protein